MKELFMKEAIKEAEKAYELSEVPVGCVLVKDGEVISRSHNRMEELKDPTAHAEMLALREAFGKLGRKWLEDCTLYVTLEPCIMCSYALVLARVKEVVFGALDERHGGVMSLYNILDDPRLNHRVRWVYLPTEECSKLLKDFFRERR